MAVALLAGGGLAGGLQFVGGESLDQRVQGIAARRQGLHQRLVDQPSQQSRCCASHHLCCGRIKPAAKASQLAQAALFRRQQQAPGIFKGCSDAGMAHGSIAQG